MNFVQHSPLPVDAHCLQRNVEKPATNSKTGWQATQ